MNSQGWQPPERDCRINLSSNPRVREDMAGQATLRCRPSAGGSQTHNL